LGQSRSAYARDRAVLSGLGPWGGAWVASPRCSMLRLGALNVTHQTVTGQTPSPGSCRRDERRPGPVSRAAIPRSPRSDRPTCGRCAVGDRPLQTTALSYLTNSAADRRTASALLRPGRSRSRVIQDIITRLSPASDRRPHAPIPCVPPRHRRPGCGFRGPEWVS
jgi:hypothetical protein